ncbi:endospore germination permease [Paenibacillus sp. MBLB4367]|uniref:GerAB/ArcD/ProY family transporter n=1 Tax=Paenibacillus sp. MBLB4367 TaxID=3384767 RepID=UPI003907EAC8
MSQKRYIGNLQVAGMACSVLSVANMLSLPMALTQLSLQDSLYTFFFAALYCIGIAFLLYKLAERVPGKNMFEIAKHLCGNWLGSILNLLLIGYLLYDLVGLLRIFADYFNSSILLRTPLEFIILITVAVLVYFGSGSIEDLVRTNDLFIPIFIIFFLLDPLLFLNEIDLTQLQPSLSGSWISPYQSGLLGMGAFGDIIVIGSFLNNVKSPRSFYISVRGGIMLSALALTIWIFLVITVVSPITASRIIYIGWILVQQIHITDFLDRVDLVLISSWLPLLLIKMLILYLSILTGLATFTKDNSYKRLNMMTGLMIILLTTVSFKNVMEVVTFSNYGILPITFTVEILFFGALFGALWLRRREKTELHREDKSRAGRGMWIALAGCFAAIVFGNFFGHLRGFYGAISVIAYILFMILSVILALNEYSRIKLSQNKGS